MKLKNIKKLINNMGIIILEALSFILFFGMLILNKNLLLLVGGFVLIFTLIFIYLFIYGKNRASKQYKITSKSILSNNEATFSIIFGIFTTLLMIFGILNKCLSTITVIEILVLFMLVLYLTLKMTKKEFFEDMIIDELKAEAFKKSSIMLILSFWIYLVLIFNFIAFFNVNTNFSIDVVAYIMTNFILILVLSFIYCFKKYT
ncbi:hypothetical protein ACO3VM_01690 [Methanocaldococcus sp. 10A]